MRVDSESERSFIDALTADPDDDARAVYTDWLEERADPRAEYLRREAEVHELGKTSNDLDWRQLELLGKELDPEWCKLVTRPRIVAPPRVRVDAAPAVPTLTSPSVTPVESPLAHRPAFDMPKTESPRWKTTAYTVFILVALLLLLMPQHLTWRGVLEAIVESLYESAR